MSEPELSDVEKLIRLKRYERPSKEFLDRFMADFRNRQRSEMLLQSAHGLFFERLSTWAWGMGRWKWVYAGGAAAALAISGGLFLKMDATEIAIQLRNETGGAQPAQPAQPVSTEGAEPVEGSGVKNASSNTARKTKPARAAASGTLMD